MKELLILVQAKNEEDQIRECLNSLRRLIIPDGFVSQLYVILDRCNDQTKTISQELGVNILEKTISGDYESTSANNIIFALENIKFGQYILKCDADIQEIPEDIIVELFTHLIGDIKRVSPEVHSRSGKWWLDFIFWLSDMNRKVTPLGKEPRGAFCIFSRETVEQVGFDKTSRSWDTGFDNRIKQKGWSVKKVDNIVVTEKRNFTLKRLIKRQIGDGTVRRKLRLSFKRTILHSIFRGRPFVLYGYVKEVLTGG